MVQLPKQERVGMNEAGSITDLAMCEDAIQTAVQKHSFKGYKSSWIYTWLTARWDQQGLVTEALFQVILEQR